MAPIPYAVSLNDSSVPISFKAYISPMHTNRLRTSLHKMPFGIASSCMTSA
jgi:hypothetical protein